ncbi:hypothetical protein Scep_029549 [Stephania cephalantha]|uniref:Glucose-methanol-choline oxidoreductase N-terminal domain-containing protein n=1 Tax=Stephania cephalantha TaxID=152367 RepID=A0AAP0E5L7_9MAGN
MNQLYESGEMLYTLDGKKLLLAGTIVGGGSAVNWSTSIKTPSTVLTEWAINQRSQRGRDLVESREEGNRKILGLLDVDIVPVPLIHTHGVNGTMNWSHSGGDTVMAPHG